MAILALLFLAIPVGVILVGHVSTHWYLNWLMDIIVSYAGLYAYVRATDGYTDDSFASKVLTYAVGIPLAILPFGGWRDRSWPVGKDFAD